MQNLLEELKNKYHYNDELLSFLNDIIPIMINYYGEDKLDIIINTLRNCEIHIESESEDKEQFLKEFFNSENVSMNDVYYEGRFIDKLMKVDNKPKPKGIIYVPTKRRDTYEPFDLKDNNNRSTLIHELSHAIKSNKEITQLSDDTYEYDSGMMKTIYTTNPTIDHYIPLLTMQEALEESVNSYDEDRIMSLYLNKEYDGRTYHDFKEIIKELFKDEKLNDLMHEATFTKSEEWIQYLGKDKAKMIVDNLERSLYLYKHGPLVATNEEEAVMKNEYAKLILEVYNYAKERNKELESQGMGSR